MSVEVKPIRFALIVGVLNVALYHIPFFRFALGHIDFGSFSGWLNAAVLFVLLPLLNALIVYLLCLFSRRVAKGIWFVLFLINAVAMYFIATFSVMLDERMVGNVLNTNVKEAVSFWSWGLVAYVVFLGMLPGVLILCLKVRREGVLKSLKGAAWLVSAIILLFLVNIKSVAWVHSYSEELGSYIMPWSYVVNVNRYYLHKYKNSRKEILLPEARVKDNERALMVLVIGESARRENFSLYGYERCTNPFLEGIKDSLRFFEANSAATYTIAGVKAMLEHTPSRRLYECLPSYLHRSGVYVVWRSVNTGEPRMRVDKFLRRDDLAKLGNGDSKYDEVLLNGLCREIEECPVDKMFLVLHMSGSHGPDYCNKYPVKFERFSPVTRSVELDKCDLQELRNVYDNTIVYTDWLLYRLIGELKRVTDRRVVMMYVSDHGESLGEGNLFMHGMQRRFAPKEQYEIPFIVWSSDGIEGIRKRSGVTQHNVFHSVLDFLSVDSPVYDRELSIFR